MKRLLRQIAVVDWGQGVERLKPEHTGESIKVQTRRETLLDMFFRKINLSVGMYCRGWKSKAVIGLLL